MPLRIPTHGPPTHPGVMLREEFLKPLGLSRKAFAAAVGLPYGRVNKIVKGQERVTAAIACRLAKYIGGTPGFWLNGQMAWDLYHAQRSEAAALEQIKPLEWADIPEVAEGAEVAETPAAAEVAAG